MESAANAGQPTSLHSEIPLTPKGQQQAEDAVSMIENIVAPDFFMVSSYKRCTDTAAPSLEKWNSVPHVVTSDIVEFHYLDFAGQLTTIDDRKAKRDAYWEKCDPDYQDGPECETFRAFMQRVCHTVQLLQESSHRNIVVFTHGFFMKALFFITMPECSQEITSDSMRAIYNFSQRVSIGNATCVELEM